MSTCRVVVCAAATLTAWAGLGAPLARAQEEGLGRPATGALGAPRSDTYGTGSNTNYVLQAYEFVPSTGAGTNIIANNYGSRGCSTSCFFEAPAMLPSGALIVAMELEACDTDAQGAARHPPGGGVGHRRGVYGRTSGGLTAGQRRSP